MGYHSPGSPLPALVKVPLAGALRKLSLMRCTVVLNSGAWSLLLQIKTKNNKLNIKFRNVNTIITLEVCKYTVSLHQDCLL